MSNVDYVIVGAGPSLSDVMTATKMATDSTEVVNGNVLITGDDCTSLTIYPSPANGTVVDVYYGGDLADRRVLSRGIYDYLVEHTDWDVELDSDDAEGIIASRVTTHA